MTNLITTEQQLETLQKQMYFAPNRVESFPVNHTFAPGVYLREIEMCAGARVIGEKHRTKHVNIITEGECLVKIGNEIAHLKAPVQFISKEGAKKIVYCLTDVKWTTVHPTDETDLVKIRELVIDTEYEAKLLLQTKELT